MRLSSSMHLVKRQSGPTWDKVPQIGSSRWAFIGVMAAVLVIVIVAIVICVCLLKRRSTKKKMRYAAHGSDLSALHPMPTFARSNAGKDTKFNDEEADAFVASSPRESLSYPGPTAGEGYGHNGMQMKDLNGRYYRGSEGFQQGYQTHAHDAQFAEPEWEPVQAPGGRYDGHGYQASVGSYEHPGYDPSGHYSQGQQHFHPSQQFSDGRAAGSSAYEPYQSSGTPSPYPPQQAHQQDYAASYSQPSSAYSQENPPSYPLSANRHNHDMPKTRMGPAAV